jgi:hypothetical protein
MPQGNKPEEPASIQEDNNMSRYKFTGRASYWEIEIGWDDENASFFYQIWDLRTEDEIDPPECENYGGTSFCEIPTLSDLEAQVGVYGVIPEETRKKLQDDFAHMTPLTPSRVRSEMFR